MEILSLQNDCSLISVDDLVAEPYASVISYPKADNSNLDDILAEIKTLGVESIIFEGPTRIGGLEVLGKGCVGIVVKAVLNDRIMALKVRRADANRPSMKAEAKFLRIANSVGVGPILESYSKNCMLMELVPGQNLKEWLSKLHRKETAPLLRSIVRDILDQCRRLDDRGIDHGELSNASKHVIVVDRPIIIDFESASTKRRPRNVTSCAQYLFLGGSTSNRVARILRILPEEQIIKVLRQYGSSAQDGPSFAELLRRLKLTKKNE